MAFSSMSGATVVNAPTPSDARISLRHLELEPRMSRASLIVVGTPLLSLDEQRKRPAATAALPLREQPVLDDQGRRRFHGAFTGGFSAGYFNTVGSAEGFTPQQFRSSRSARHSASADGGTGTLNNADVAAFMDADDLAEFGLNQGVVASAKYDMLGHTASLQHATAAAALRGAVASGTAAFVPDELLSVSRAGIGVKLLAGMGWRDGDGVGARARRRRVLAVPDADDPDHVLQTFEFAPQPVAVVSFPLKEDRRGIAFDPYKNADDVRVAAERRAQRSGTRSRLAMANVLTGEEDQLSMRGFGVGALDDDNPDEDTDVYHTAALEMYDIDVNRQSQQYRAEREARQAARARAAVGADSSARLLLEDVDALAIEGQRCSDGLPPLQGFKLASRATEKDMFFAPPAVPPGFTGQHVWRPTDDVPENLPTFRRRVTPQQRAELLSDGTRRPAPVARPAVGSVPPPQAVVNSIADRFTAAGSTVAEEQQPLAPVAVVVRRSVVPWEPARIVCKRLGIDDPWSQRQMPADAVRAIVEPKFLSAHTLATPGPSFARGTEQQPPPPPLEEPPAEPIVKPSADIFNAIFGADDSESEVDVPPPPPPPVQPQREAAQRNEFERFAQPLAPNVRAPVDVPKQAAPPSAKVSFAQLAQSLDTHTQVREVSNRPQALPIDLGAPLSRPAPVIVPKRRTEAAEVESESSSSSSSSSSSGHKHRHNSSSSSNSSRKSSHKKRKSSKSSSGHKKKRNRER
jgi:hypothetical protein